MLIVKEGTNGFEGTDEATRKLINDAFEKEGLTMRSAEQDKSYLAANSKKAIDEAFQQRNQQLEDTIKEVTGIDKANAGEKYYDYFNRAMKLKLDELKVAQGKVTEYEEKGVSGNAMAEEYKKQVTVLQGQIKEIKDTHTKEMSEAGGKVFAVRFDSQVNEVVNKLRASFRGDIAEDLIADIVSARLSKFNSEFTGKEIEGITILHDKTGTPQMSKKDAKPVSIEEKLTEIFTPYLDEKKIQGGAGSGKPAGGGAAPAGGGAPPAAWKDAKRPDTVKSKPALTKWLMTDLKIAQGTKDFDQAYAQFSKDDKGVELPMREAPLTA
jgi:hypothetical protein